QFVEAGLAELHVLEPRRLGKPARTRDMGRVEIRRKDVRLRVRRRNEICGEALSTTEVTIGDRLTPAAGSGNTRRKRRKAQDRGRLDSAKIMDVGRVSDISGAPISHTFLSPRSLSLARTMQVSALADNKRPTDSFGQYRMGTCSAATPRW